MFKDYGGNIRDGVHDAKAGFDFFFSRNNIIIVPMGRTGGKHPVATRCGCDIIMFVNAVAFAIGENYFGVIKIFHEGF